jgi:hypothetical protein
LSEDQTRAQIREMARLTMLSNRLNPIQQKNLEVYPYIFFEGVKKGTIVFDLECRPDPQDQKKTYVNYTIEIDPEVAVTFEERRREALRTAVRTLFWSNVEVGIEIKGGKRE